MSILVAITAFLITVGIVYLLLMGVGILTGIIAMCSSASEAAFYVLLVLIAILPISLGIWAGKTAYRWSKRSLQLKPALKPLFAGLLALLLIAGSFGLILCKKSENNSIREALDHDAAHFLEDRNKKEVTSWLAESDANHIDTLTPAESSSLAKELSSLGAKSLTAVQIDFTNHLAKIFLMELPEDPASRHRLFHWYVEDLKRQNSYEPDLGQDFGEHYLFISRGKL